MLKRKLDCLHFITPTLLVLEMALKHSEVELDVLTFGYDASST